jgi:hypothetical protein
LSRVWCSSVNNFEFSSVNRNVREALHSKCTRALTFEGVKYYNAFVFVTQSLRATLHSTLHGTEEKMESSREIDRAPRLGCGGGGIGVEREWDSFPLFPKNFRHHTLSPQPPEGGGAEGVTLTLAEDYLTAKNNQSSWRHEFARDVCAALRCNRSRFQSSYVGMRSGSILASFNLLPGAHGDTDLRNSRNLASELALQVHDACSPLRCYKLLQIVTNCYKFSKASSLVLKSCSL